MVTGHPPGPAPLRGWAFVRFIYNMQVAPLDTVRRRFERYGDLYFTVSRGDPLMVTRHPDHFHEVLVARAADFDKRNDLEPLLGRGLLTSNGDHWRHHRRLIQPAFRHERLRHYATTMVAAADAVADRWQQTGRSNVGEDMMRLTLQIVGKALFDYDPGAEVDRVARCMDVLQRSAIALDVFPAWMPTPLHTRTNRALRDLDELILAMIKSRRDHSAATNHEATDLLGHLLANDALSERQLRDELVTLFLAGHETTALALTWTWWLLAQHPAWEQKLHDELDRVLDGRPPDIKDLEALDVTRRILNESMRLYPPVYAVPRIANRDTTVGGFPVAAGTEVIMWPYWAHRDGRWFPDPNRFDPDRFLPGSVQLQNSRAYVPFGAGNRTCIGRNFAIMEGQLVLARLAQRCALRSKTDQHPGLRPRITLGPKHPIRMTVVDRLS